MKKSRVFLSFLLALFTLIISLSGCDKGLMLENYVSELRSDVFYGESDEYKLKAFYGYREHDYVNDGKVGEKEYLLSFRLLDKETDGATYTVKFNHLEKDYSSTFSFDPLSGVLTCQFEIENFTEKIFTVTILCAEKTNTVTLSSLVPENTANYKTALNKLKETHKTLIDAYVDENGNFTAEIYMRIIVKDEKPFWYVGFASGNDNLKALLIDGLTLEVLAIRDIF